MQNYNKNSSVSDKNGVKYVELKGRVNYNGKRINVKVILKTDKQGKVFFYSVMRK